MMAKKILGDLVKEERLRRNLSQNSLAEQAHVSLRTVSDIENYNGNPTLETLCLLASYLNISLDAVILNDQSSMDPSLRQIVIELNRCSERSRRLALSTLRGLLSGIEEQ